MPGYPYVPIADDWTNDTPADVGGPSAGVGAHPHRHNLVKDALNALLAELGASPKGASADLTARLATLIAATIVNAKGDLIVASADDVVARLPVGSNGKVLTADSTQTLGVAWTTPASGSGGGGGSVATDPLWNAKGDLAAASGNDAASRLGVGSNGQVLTADSTQTLGLRWTTPASGSGGGGSVATDAIWDAVGDLAAGSGPNTAARLPVGTDGDVLTADSGEALGVKWGPASGGAMELVGRTFYNPGSSADYDTTTTIADVDMDGTTPSVAFEAGDTGEVIVYVEVQAFPNPGGGNLFFGLRESTTNLDSYQVRAEQATNQVDRIGAMFNITGLTPGSSHTYKLAAKHSVQPWRLRCGGGVGQLGPVVMLVWAVPS